ncbi:V-type ATP synthase subunit I [Halocatena marina]|uniref:A-type ATP synthase subunit I n=1 Tax=Halocatena marina TaxID=2934937 RepID=A0ABD5YUC7_9EURY|nr:V-type ATP synthase subunit I [Halocatena marina]
MLRPERMSRVSVTGSRQVMNEVIETIHDMNLLHVTDYDGGWDGFDPGDPIEGADEAAEKLVTVRSLQSILGIDDEDAGPNRIVTEDALDSELETVRQTVNELDDRRNELNDELRQVNERIDAMVPFATLGIDLDLLSGYDSISVAVGDGDAVAVDNALAGSDASAYEVFEEDEVVAAFARTDDIEDVLVSADFALHEIPDADGSPEDYIEELKHDRQRLESKLRTVEDELEEQRLEYGAFLLAAEEKLTIEVQQQEAPLSFATTKNAFVSEGWIPTEHFADLVEGLYDVVGDHVEVDELERASYDGEGHLVDREDVGGTHGGPDPAAATTDGGEEVVSDGGVDQSMSHSSPPVVQDNPDPVEPFESLVKIINRPKYSELDPTFIVFLSFPALFGFMIGDLGYGVLYAAIGYYIFTKFDGVAKSLGGIALWSGGFTMLFGILYGEIFGLHILGEVLWHGHPPLHKGLQPAEAEYAQLWLVVSLLIGMAHMTIGYVFDFYENLSHGVGDAILESGSWLMMMFGLWAWIFANTPPFGVAPDFLVGSNSVFNAHPVAIGFTGLPAMVGYLGLISFFVGLVLIAQADVAEFVEAIFLQVFANVLSYTRIAAVLLAKAGMAFVVNLLVFGAYVHHGEYHFIFFSKKSLADIPPNEVMFAGLVNGSGPVDLLIGSVAGLIILVIGHLLVLVLGITSAGLQTLRLEYVEFFQKFYEGGGEKYQPFGYARQFTTDD